MRRLRSLLSESWPSARALRRAAILGATAAAAFGVTTALASFGTSVTGGPGTYVSKRIFPGVRSASTWTVRDASGGGSEAVGDDALSYNDAVVKATSNWASSYASNRYLEFDFNGPRPAGVAVTTAQFNFRMASNGSGETSCFYFEVYRASTSTLLGTYGSTASSVGCNSTTTQTTYSQTISEITSTTAVNDLRIRVYGKESGGKPMKIDTATVTGSTAYDSFTMYEKILRDQADTSVTTTPWGEATSGDGTSDTSAGNWSTNFATTRYMKFTFDPAVPTGSVITSATLDFQYKSNTSGDTACWYFETYNGSTLLGSHGSSSSPQSCNSTTSFSTDNVTLSELTSVTNANNLTIKVYMKESGSKKTLYDLIQLNLNYYLD
jgi:hypothetical protein